MQKGVLIKDGEMIIEKRAYGGDTSMLEDQLIKEGVDYEIFDDTDLAFVSAEVSPLAKEQDPGWSVLDTVEEKISYIAKFLGIE